MRPFKHIQASTIEEAAALAAHEDVMVIAGGTDLLGTLKDECLLKTSRRPLPGRKRS